MDRRTSEILSGRGRMVGQMPTQLDSTLTQAEAAAEAAGPIRVLGTIAVIWTSSGGCFVNGTRFALRFGQWRNAETNALATPQQAAAISRVTANVSVLQEAGGLRTLATRAHGLVEGIARRQSTIAVAEVRLADGTRELWAAASSRGLTTAQRNLLESQGIRIIGGGRHAEMNIIENLPQGARVERWGISRSSGQTNIPCPECVPEVSRVGGIIE